MILSEMALLGLLFTMYEKILIPIAEGHVGVYHDISTNNVIMMIIINNE
jgi:hypothetical protein